MQSPKSTAQREQHHQLQAEQQRHMAARTACSIATAVHVFMIIQSLSYPIRELNFVGQS